MLARIEPAPRGLVLLGPVWLTFWLHICLAGGMEFAPGFVFSGIRDLSHLRAFVGLFRAVFTASALPT